MRLTNFFGLAVLFWSLPLPGFLSGQDKRAEQEPNPPVRIFEDKVIRDPSSIVRELASVEQAAKRIESLAASFQQAVKGVDRLGGNPSVPILSNVPIVDRLFHADPSATSESKEILVIEMHLLAVDVSRLHEHQKSFPELMGKDELEKRQNPLRVSEIDSAKVDDLVRKLLDLDIATVISRPTLALLSDSQGQVEVNTEGTKKKIVILPRLNKEKTMVQLETRIEVQTNKDPAASIPSIRTQFVDFAFELKLGSTRLIENSPYWSLNGQKDEKKNDGQKMELMIVRVSQPPKMVKPVFPRVSNEPRTDEAASLHAIHQELKLIHKDVDRLIQLLESRK